MCAPRRVSRWACPYCSFVRARKDSPMLKAHIHNCFKNPNRVPYLGELSRHEDTFEIKDFGSMGDDGPPGCRWYEAVEIEAPAWWPGRGYIYTAEGWKPVPGYSFDAIGGAHGVAGGDPYMDYWPEVSPGVELDELKRMERLRWFVQQAAQESAQGDGRAEAGKGAGT